MSTSNRIPDNSEEPALICRGCLKECGEMKNMHDWGLDVDFFKYTGIPKFPSKGMPQLLCTTCELDLQNTKSFKDKCHQSHRILRSNLKSKSGNGNKTSLSKPKCDVTSILEKKKITFIITAPNPDEKIPLKCPYAGCKGIFFKKFHLIQHIWKSHDAVKDFEIDLQYHCEENGCIYNKASVPSKHFSGRKYLNQHHNKIHKVKKYACKTCAAKFSVETDYNRHLNTCTMTYHCPLCANSYATNETFLVHLSRKHPNLHAKYKLERKAQKRPTGYTGLNLSELIEIPRSKKLKLAQQNDSMPVSVLEEAVVSENAEIPNTNENVDNVENAVVINTSESVRKVMNPVKITSFPQCELNMTDSMNAMNNIDEPVAGITGRSFEESDFRANGLPFNEECVNEVTIIDDYVIEEEIVEDIAEESEARGSEDYLDEACSQSQEKMLYVFAGNQDEGSQIGEDPLEKECYIDDLVEDSEIMKKASATQIPEDISNDVSLNSWSISTQTAFQDFLSVKSQNTVDEMFFSESVSLSDIQTQTLPLEFGLSRCNKETQVCTPESPDLSIKETQTCFCLNEPPRVNFRLFDSPASSPTSNFISTETQTAGSIFPIHTDVLLSFSSAETQTYFDDEDM